MSLQGANRLRSRLRAMRQVFKPVGREWADTTARVAQGMVPVETGKTRASIRRRNASMRRATVVGRYPVNFIDAGTKPHDIVARKAKVLAFSDHGTTVFRRKVHKRAQPARPFKRRAAEEGLRRSDPMGQLLKLWNGAD